MFGPGVWGLVWVNEKSYAIIMFWNNDTGAVPVLGVVIVVLWATLWAALGYTMGRVLGLGLAALPPVV